MRQPLDPPDRAAFDEAGVLSLRGAIPASRVEAARQALLEQLDRLRLREHGRWHTKKLEGVPHVQLEEAEELDRGRHDFRFGPTKQADLLVARLSALAREAGVGRLAVWALLLAVRRRRGVEARVSK